VSQSQGRREPDPPNDRNVVVHLTPVWRAKADFLIQGLLDDWEALTHSWEQVWCKKITAEQFEVCCIPFFLYGVSLGDIVQTKPTFGVDYSWDCVVVPSGHQTYRVWFGGSNDDDHQIRHKLVDRLLEREVVAEWYGANLLAIDGPPEQALWITALLTEGHEAGDFIFEVANPAMDDDEDRP
jgi:hypothetical protein